MTEMSFCFVFLLFSSFSPFFSFFFLLPGFNLETCACLGHMGSTLTFAPAFELNKESASLSDQLTVPGDIIEFSPCCCPLLRCCHTGDPWMNRLRPNVISREIGGGGGGEKSRRG